MSGALGRLRTAGLSALRSDAVGNAAIKATRGKFRIVSYHGVPDRDLFARHVDYYADRWEPVSGEQVRSSLRGGPGLSERAVWITFDDGESSVVRNALPTLVDAGVPATMFVCPGLVENREPFWWQVVDRGARFDVLPDELASADDPIEATKRATDQYRRDVTRDVVDRLDSVVVSQLVDAVADLGQLGEWHSAGLEVANHSWDHPLLDKCTPEDQYSQVSRAHEWLADNGFGHTSFAYPNGNHVGADGAARALRGHSYEIAVLHDHRLTSFTADPHRVSRLKVEAEDSVSRLNSIVSGVQPAIRAAADRLTPKAGVR